jgi:hypothetical protein
MELPANPNQIFLTGYDEYGRPMDEKKKSYLDRSWQLNDYNPYDEERYDQSGIFDMKGEIF